MQGRQVRSWQHGREFIVCDAALIATPQPELFDAQWWMRQGLVEASFEGRGTVHVVRHGDARWVLRRYQRGGLVAKVAEKTYVWAGLERTRPWREWQLLARLRELGLPVPRPVAAHVQRADLRYSGHILTELIEDAQSLQGALRAGSWSRADWQRLGATLRRFHDAGVHHPDLNVSNILRRADGELFLVDFDKGRLGASARQQRGELARLRHSLRKLAVRSGRELHTDADWKRMLGGYAGGR
jgi:3-deoxy-D-manno-octulosonic acid kinase